MQDPVSTMNNLCKPAMVALQRVRLLSALLSLQSDHRHFLELLCGKNCIHSRSLLFFRHLN